MSEKPNYLDCWISVAASLFSQALAGEPGLTDALPKPMPAGSFGFAMLIEGDEEGRFAVMLDGALAEAALFGEGTDQKAGWAELLKEVADSAAGELLAKTGRKCQVKALHPSNGESRLSRAFQLKAGDSNWLIQINSEVKLATAKPAKTAERQSVSEPPAHPEGSRFAHGSNSDTSRGDDFSPATARQHAPGLSPGLEM